MLQQSFARATAALVLCLLTALCVAQPADPLPSWNEGETRAAIIDFVATVTEPGGEGFVPDTERVAVFDNDGTLWGEQPMYYQALFIIDRVRALAPEHPEYKTQEPFASILKGDLKTAFAGGKQALLEMVMATHANLTAEEFSGIVAEWLASARHPETGRPYTEMTYQPMLELLDYLRVNGFKTFIVSGGGIDFLRVFAEEVYGIPPEQVVGSSLAIEFSDDSGQLSLRRQPEIGFIDDKAGKPVGIHQHIGRRPIAAFGNSDGDLQMLQWTTAGDGPRLGVLIHHTDAEREYAYDRDSHIGKLDEALDQAGDRGWTVVNMQRDWNTIYP